ncbi:MAG TPA: peptidoglycan endopeptidase [Allosphingosinicella sp.]|jgi:cell wall-associated NlpC family hydrolase|nr:peptidoglycan endopeptidase [Allosphingosinicella sp.]
MTARAERVVARARALIGVKFRPQGRLAANGLDCIGVVAAAIDVRTPPGDYALRGGSAARLAEGLAAAGLRPVAAARPGDVLVLVPGPAQLHLGVLTEDGLIHGDAGLRRVVERPGPAPWPIAGIWRIGEDIWRP